MEQHPKTRKLDKGGSIILLYQVQSRNDVGDSNPAASAALLADLLPGLALVAQRG